MGFFKKLWNFVSGKGWQEEELLKEEEQTIKEPTREEELQESLERAEAQTPIEKEEEIPVPEPPKQFTVTEPQEKEEKEEVERATKRFSGSGSLANVQEQLTEGTINSIDFQPTTNLGELNQLYNKLLQRSTISTTDKDGNIDQALIDVLIENRNKLQHRFTAEIRIITDGGEGFMSIDGILAEHMGNIGEYIQVGGTYTSQELQVAMQNALTYFEKQYGSIGGNIRPPMNKKVTIQDLQIRMTFA